MSKRYPGDSLAIGLSLFIVGVFLIGALTPTKTHEPQEWGDYPNPREEVKKLRVRPKGIPFKEYPRVKDHRWDEFLEEIENKGIHYTDPDAEEEFDKGKKLLQEIASLESHLEMVMRPSEDNRHAGFLPYSFSYSEGPGKEKLVPSFRAKAFYSASSVDLLNRFVPFPIDRFMEVYEINVRKEIDRLQKEFDNL